MKVALSVASVVVLGVVLAMPACTLDTQGLGPVPKDASTDLADDDDDRPSPDDEPDAATEASVSCAENDDVDRDGHKRTECGGDDCCDTDRNTFPGQTEYFAVPSNCGGFDHDCDGEVTPEFGLADCRLRLLSCEGDGFAAEPACGAAATFVRCRFATTTCSEDRSTRVKRCR